METLNSISSGLKLIADCGGTKTEWWLVGGGREGSEIAGHCLTEGANATVSKPSDIAETARKAAEVFGSLIPETIYFYGAGCVGEETRGRIRKGLETVWPGSRTEIESDMLAAARSLLGHEPGIACILGTGSNACMYDGEKITGGVPSLGFILGDHGSGASIGKRLIADVIQSHMPEDLRIDFLKEFPVTREQVLANVYSRPGANAYLARFTRFLSPRKEYPYVNRLLLEEFCTFLERTVLPCSGATSLPIAFAGSIAHHFKDTLLEAARKKGVRIARISPEIGEGLLKYHTK